MIATPIEQSMERIVAKMDLLPPLPETTVRLVQVVRNPASSLDEVVEILRFDQTVTMELLRLCNSAYFALPRQVRSVSDAVKLLGVAKVVQLVVAVHARGMLSTPQHGYGLRPGALWTHSVGVGLAAQRLAERIGCHDTSLLFTAGLVHDVGKIVLNEFVGEVYGEIAQEVAEAHVPFVEAERRVLGFTHAEVGEKLALRWRLPDTIRCCVRYHHEPWALDRCEPCVDAIHLADTICILMGVGGGDDGLSYRPDMALVRRYGLTERDFEEIGVEVIAELKSVQEMFGTRAGAARQPSG